MLQPNSLRSDASSRLKPYFLSAAILSLAFWLRVTNLYNTPIFFDEGDHIVWAQRFSVHDNTYPFLMDGKFLLGVLLAQFHVLGPAPLWLSRAVVAIFSLVSCAACIAIGRLLGASKGGLLAGILYAVLPQAVFFERQTFADPLMASFGLAAAVCTLRIAKKPRSWLVVLMAALLGAAFLFKLFGVIYLAFPVLACIVLPSSHKKRAETAILYLTSIVVAAILVAGLLGGLRSRLGYSDSHLIGQQIGFIGCPAILCHHSAVEQMRNLLAFGNALAEAISLYFGWLITILALLAWPLGLPAHRRNVLFFSLATLGMLIPFAFAAKGYVPPRYLGFLAAPIAILAATTMAALAARLPAIVSGVWARFSVVGALLLLIALWPVANIAPMIAALEKAHLTNIDRQVYIWPWIGPGIRGAAFAVWESDQPDHPPPVVLSGNIYLHLVGAYFDRTRIDVRGLGEAYPADIGRWLFEGQTIYIFDELPGVETPGLLTEEVGRYPRREGAATVRLRRVTGTDSALREEIYREFFIKPEKLEYQAFVNTLPQTEEMALLVYPPNHIQALAPLVAADHPTIAVIPVGDSWPLDVAATEGELQSIAAQHASIRVIFVEETKGDPQRQMEAWLNTHLYRLEEQWFGLVRVVAFAGNGVVTQTIPVGARFGDGITLESAEVLDSVSPPGGPIRVRLNWRADSAISQSLKVFVHIFAGETIVAQHDGQPMGELRPTNTWQAGEQIVDQFAIRLPADVQPGDYQLRIGLYDVSSLARLPVSMPDGSMAEFFVGGAITVK